MSCYHEVAVCNNHLSVSISFAVTALTEKESEKTVAFAVNGGNRNALLTTDNPVTMREYKSVYDPKYQFEMTKRADNCSEMAPCAPEEGDRNSMWSSIEAAGPTQAENVPQFWKPWESQSECYSLKV